MREGGFRGGKRKGKAKKEFKKTNAPPFLELIPGGKEGL